MSRQRRGPPRLSENFPRPPSLCSLSSVARQPVHHAFAARRPPSGFTTPDRISGVVAQGRRQAHAISGLTRYRHSHSLTSQRSWAVPLHKSRPGHETLRRRGIAGEGCGMGCMGWVWEAWVLIPSQPSTWLHRGWSVPCQSASGLCLVMHLGTSEAGAGPLIAACFSRAPLPCRERQHP